MDIHDLGQRLSQALEEGDINLVMEYLSPEFQFVSNQLLQPLDKNQWMDVTRTWKKAFPDLRYNFRIERIEGNKIHFTTAVRGTHNEWLDLGIIGQPAVKATGKSISLLSEPGVVEVKRGKIFRIQVTSTENSGIMGILKQLSLPIPASMSVRS